MTSLPETRNVWRSINDEHREQRPDAFVQWWSQQRTDTREAIRKLRNAEMKKNVLQIGAVSRARSPDRIRIHDDGRITLIREDSYAWNAQASASRATPPEPTLAIRTKGKRDAGD